MATETQDTTLIDREKASLLDCFGTFKESISVYVQLVGKMSEQLGIALPADVKLERPK